MQKLPQCLQTRDGCTVPPSFWNGGTLEFCVVKIMISISCFNTSLKPRFHAGQMDRIVHVLTAVMLCR